MKVLMTTDTLGGVWNYSVQLCRSLETHGVTVVLATMGAPLSRAQRQQAAGLHNVDLRESEFRLEWMQDAWDDVHRAGDWLLGLERATRPDVVHLNGYVHGELPWSAPVLIVGHSCVLSWWRAVRGANAPAEWNRYRERVRAGLRAAQLVAAPTRAMLNALVEHYGPLPHGVVISNGCDPVERDAEVERSTAAERDTGPIVLAAGRIWDESKNMQVLAEAAPNIRGQVCVAGSDVHPTRGGQPLKGVRALGMLPPAVLRGWYRRALVFVHPAIYEPFGLAPLEAALERCPLVLGDIPSLREVWGDAAQYVPSRDPAAIATAVNALLDDPDRRERAAASALARARALSASRMAVSCYSAYRTLCARAAMLRGAVACVS